MQQNSFHLRRLGFIGFGAIGITSIEALRNARSSGYDLNEFLAGVLLRPTSQIPEVPDLADDTFVIRVEDLIARCPELIVECAGHQALQQHGVKVLEAGIDLLVVSSGALANPDLLKQLREQAQTSGSKLYVAPGAIGGLDWLNAADLAGLTKVVYKSRKSPAAWVGTDAPETSDKAEVFYKSSVREAALLFPRNVNAAATVALAGLGLDATELELISDPHITQNVHEIYAEGVAGTLEVRLQNATDLDNPRTSLITGYSIAQCILCNNLTVVG